ncbi:UDP-N-acetylglucosamine 1-carboxyvinyltransferase [Streptacidiphilus melanogenes]|uniref:UDP-N-acetylglucosamine 1-carboxyvinyltransferase n=1 Tax=Streptacidiphilus melanogenes TaxID=411235 RepID=UPI0005A916CE|nr:UDP-N-acetylglucosamine 1-carboxyvinyltransferase [Streptacidiphilus melanogenes]
MTTTALPTPADLNSTLVQITGGRPLHGRIRVQGSKNIALHLYAATLVADTPTVLRNCPDILDTGVCAAILRHTRTGVAVEADRFTVTPAARLRPEIHPVLGRQVRTTAVLAAAVLAKAGHVTFPAPGGDAFCPRLIDRHLAAMQAAGAEVRTEGDVLQAVMLPGGPHPFITDVNTPYGPSLGATVTAMLLAARAKGTSLITSPSIEPEVTETARLLEQGGVGIDWDDAGLHVSGTSSPTGSTFTVAGDRIEAGTMLMAAAATKGSIELEGITLHQLPTGLREALGRAGIAITSWPGGTAATWGPLEAVTTATGPHPGLPTDTAPQLAALLTQAEGVSLIHERIYPSRDTHVDTLAAYGADIATQGSTIRIKGATALHAADVEAADIRAVTALLLAALAAEGTSTIRGMYHLRRGYGQLLTNLATLGADITTLQEP